MSFTLCAALLLVFFVTIEKVSGHGYLTNPAARNAIWKTHPEVPDQNRNYDVMAVFCGGLEGLRRNGGKCGVCGDRYDRPRDHESGGRFASKIIAKSYNEGQNITAQVRITANHGGNFKFDLCQRKSWDEKETDGCFQPLKFSNGQDMFSISMGDKKRYYTMDIKLPDGVKCSNCILRWKWIAGNQGPGARMEEEWINCADINIGH